MAILDITTYDSLASDVAGRVIPVGREPSLQNIQVAITGTSTQSAAISDRAKLARLHCDVACRIAIGTNPTASATTQRMSAGQTEYFGVAPGDKVAVISTT